MLKNISYTLFLLLFMSCSGGSDDSEEAPTEKDIIPTNLTLTINIVGADASNPNGDGTGVIICTATATDAVKYGFKFESNDIGRESISGSSGYTYSLEGINTYMVTAFAYSSTGNAISTFKKIIVLVDFNSPKLVWSDEFNINGQPDSSKWGYDIGNGCPSICGWGNGESQYYTKIVENVIVKDGVLKITARKENYEGSQYTSTRMLTKGKYDFTYGKVEVRAKLPQGSGTWPAIWMLGANIDTVGWPACGEIDIMEHWGHNATIVTSATHTPSCSGGCVGTKVGETVVSDYSSQFHVYGLEWTEEELRFSIDGQFLYTYNPPVKNSSNWPYNKPQFFILNIAMGGSWFNIDPSFSESTMEVDYIRVYK